MKDIDAIISDLLATKDPQNEALARLLATGISETIEAFVEAERTRGSEPTSVVAAIVKLTSAEIFSLLDATAIPGARTESVKLVGWMFTDLLHNMDESAPQQEPDDVDVQEMLKSIGINLT